MRLVPLEIGKLNSARSIIDGGEGMLPFPIPSWLIEHEHGLVLFDTGLHVDLQTSTDRIGPSATFFDPDFSPGEELTARLEQRGIRTTDITHMVFSHLHFDHAGGTVEIPDARIVLQGAEWDAAHESKYIERNIYNPDDFDHGHDVETIDGEHDLFGDGLVTCIPTPGHTPGHQSLRLELESGPVVLTGDCVYTEAMMDDMAVPKFGHDTDLQVASMRELARLRDEDGCRLLFGHDEDQFRSLPTEGLV